MDSSSPNSRPGKLPSPASHSSRTSAAAIANRPTVYITSHGRTRGGAAGPPAGLTGTDGPPGFPDGLDGPDALDSAMTALPLGRENHGRARARDAPDPV